VVELQNDRIALAAINARVGCQVLPHAKLVLFRADGSHLLHMSEMLIPVSQVPEPLVLDVAGLAPRLANAPLAILEAELIDGFFDAASSASWRDAIEHAFYRLRVEETSTSAREFGQRLVFISARDDNNMCVRHACWCGSVLQSPDPAFLFF